MSAEAKFIKGDPPKAVRGPQVYDEVQELLRSKPGVWAEITRSGGGRWLKANAYKLRDTWGRKGFEVQPREINGTIHVYARYVGEVTA